MTEYDYSPQAQQAYQAKLAGIARWSQNVPSRPSELANPFVPPSRSETDFYAPKLGRSKSKHRHSKKSLRRPKPRQWDSDSESTDDGYDGPDRPPTPPASAPAHAGVPFGGGYTSPWPQQQQPMYPGAYVPPQQAPQAQVSVMVPVWNGTAWVYTSPPISPHRPPQNSAHDSTGRHHSRREHDEAQDGHRGRDRLKSSRRNSHSVPPPISPPLVPNGGSYMVYPAPIGGGLVPPQQHNNSSPASAWSAPLPVTSPPAYGAPQVPAAHGYFGPQPQAQPFYGGGYVSPPAIMSPVVVGGLVQSPSGSVYSYGNGAGSAGYYGSPQVSAYGSTAGCYPMGYYYGGGGGMGHGVVIVDGAKPRKEYEGKAYGHGAARPGSMKSGKSGRSLWGKLVGGM